MGLRGVAALRLVLALFLPALYFALPVVAGSSPIGIAGALTASLTAALVAVALHVRLAPGTAPATVRTVSLCEIARSAAFLRLRDPDARGRTRPRAPSPGSAAA